MKFCPSLSQFSRRTQESQQIDQGNHLLEGFLNVLRKAGRVGGRVSPRQCVPVGSRSAETCHRGSRGQEDDIPLEAAASFRGWKGVDCSAKGSELEPAERGRCSVRRAWRRAGRAGQHTDRALNISGPRLM